MNRILFAAFLLSASPALAAEPQAKPDTAATARPAALTDPEIAHIAVTANQIDVDAGKAALKKTKNDKVKEFAQRMVDDHDSVIKEAQALVKKLKVTPKDNKASKDLNASADKTKKTLAGLKGDEFDKAYVDNEVAYHQAVIDTVDNTLLANVQNTELKDLLDKVRPILGQHLDHAKSLQQTLASGSTMGTGGSGETKNGMGEKKDEKAEKKGEKKGDVKKSDMGEKHDADHADHMKK